MDLISLYFIGAFAFGSYLVIVLKMFQKTKEKALAIPALANINIFLPCAVMLLFMSLFWPISLIWMII